MKSKIPEGWKSISVSDLGKVITGKTPKTKNKENYTGKTPFLTPSDDMESRFIQTTERTLSEVGMNTVNNQVIPKNSVCVSCIGSQLGKVVITNEDTVTNQQINSIVVGEEIDYMYVYYAMLLLGDRLRYISKTSTAVPIINKTNFSKEKLLLPSLGEQKTIADTLSSLDSEIELNNKTNQNLEQQAQAIFKHWFVDFEFPDQNGKPYKSSGGKMVESELGMIPEGWGTKPLDQLISRIDNRGKTPPYEDGETDFPLLDVATLRGVGRVVNYDKVTKYVSENTYKNWFRNGHPKEKDILISTVGSLAEMKLFIGNVGCIAQNVVALRSKGISEFYLYEYLKFIKGDLVSYDIGTVQPSIKITHIIKHHILTPQHEYIEEYEKITEKMSRKIYSNNLQNQILSQLRDTLLPKLMNGEIRIPLD